jgi:DNA polymerase-3 subunit delta
VTALKAHEVARFLARSELPAGAYLAYGPDAGLVHETALRVIQGFARGAPDAETLVLDAAEIDADPSLLAREALTRSLFGGLRLIRIRGTGKGLTATLAALLDQLDGAVIAVEAGNLTPRDALRALFEGHKGAFALPCYPDSDETLTALFRDTFAKAGIALDPDVVPTLREILGNDREVTRRELEKLTLFAAHSKVLTRQDVLTLCADNAALAIDELCDAAGTGHGQKLDSAFTRAIAGGTDPQRLLASANLHFAALRRWRSEVDGGRSPGEVLDGARPKPHFSRRSALEQQLRSWSDPALAAATERLHRTTLETRSTSGLAEPLTRRALLAICRMVAER